MFAGTNNKVQIQTCSQICALPDPMALAIHVDEVQLNLST